MNGLLDYLSGVAGRAVGGGERGAFVRGLFGMDAPVEPTPLQRDLYENAVRIAAPALGAGKAIFIGAKAKNWDKVAAEAAVALEKAGGKAEDIWRQTKTMRLPEGKLAQEISDHSAVMRNNPNARTIGEAIDHPELFKAYPELANRPFGIEDLGPTVRGSLDPYTDKITLSSKLAPADQRSTMVHELNHAAQEIEGFGRGGSRATATRDISQNMMQAQAPYREDMWKYQAGMAEMGPASKGLYFKKLEALTQKNNIKPSDVNNMSDWYQYANDIRSKYGAPPTKPGAARDAWYQNAADFILQKNLAELKTPWSADPRSQMTVKELENQYRRGSRKMAAAQEGNRAFSEIEDRYKAILKMPDYEQYLRLPGEAMSRLAQNRLDYTPELRDVLFPLRELDIPLREYGGGGLLKP